jgi:pyruvate/2-oxoglutarate dehydrogenase complex dihydrolipoamide acyltransferase (E2) component
MKFEMKMPDLSTTNSAVKVLNWFVEVGGAVRQGQAVIEVETDKATMEVEATVNGTLIEKGCEPGAQVEVGEVIAIIQIEDGSRNRDSPGKVAPSIQIEKMQAPAPPPVPKKEGSMFARNRAIRKSPS